MYAQVSRQRRREDGGIIRSLHRGDVRWDTLGVLRYGGCAAVAGCASSFIGIGGGIVIGFLLHEMALLPQVASATVTLITLFSECHHKFLTTAELRKQKPGA